MMDLIMPVFKTNLWYSQKAVADVPDEQMCAQPIPGKTMNHAAWLLGHMAWAAGEVALDKLGQPPSCPANYKELFGMGTQPSSERSRYPSKAELLKTLEDAFARLGEAAQKATPETLAKPAPERIRDRFPTVGALVAALMTGHHASHNGQLSAWRRAMGLPSVF
ncbi:MAG TPA: DinB family protein [Gemmataceae bacterium]|nr:DinB family protein [Gemmataceae bacterium]